MDSFQKFYNRALRFLAFRPRSEYEITLFLKKKKAEDKVIEKIVERLREHNFINDEEFVVWWIDQRTRVRPKGLVVISQELRQKGIDQKTIAHFLSRKETKELGREGAKKLATKHYAKYASLPKKEMYQKVSQILLRRGFTWDTIKQTIDEITKKE